MGRILGGGGAGAGGFELPASLRFINGKLCSQLVNRSGGALDVGQWLVAGPGDLEVQLSGTISRNVIATVAEPSASDGDPVWVTQTRFPVLCTNGPIAVGDFLEGVGSQGRARDIGFPFPGNFAIAVTSKPGGGPGVVQAMFTLSETF